MVYPNVEKAKDLVSVLELKQLLVTIVDARLQTCFRYRLLGEMWKPNFVRVLKAVDKGVLLHDEIKNQLISIPDLQQIVQFEIDQAVHAFRPHFHYGLVFEKDPT